MNITGKLKAGIASAALAVVVVGTVAVASSQSDEPTIDQTTIGAEVDQAIESTTTSTTTIAAAPETPVAQETTTTTARSSSTTSPPPPTTGKVDNGGDTPTPTDQCPEIAQPGQINGCALSFDPNGSPPKPYRECWDGTLRQECPPLSSDAEPAGN